MALELESITQAVRDYISRNFLFSDQGYRYEDDASFLREGIIDSLGIIELVTFVEKQFGISVSDQELLPSNFDSVSKLSSFITSKLLRAQGESIPSPTLAAMGAPGNRDEPGDFGRFDPGDVVAAHAALGKARA